MAQFKASPVLITFFIASSLATGKLPGWAVQTSQMLKFGRFSSGSFLHEQNILLLVFSSAWISSPTVGLYIFVNSNKKAAVFQRRHSIKTKGREEQQRHLRRSRHHLRKTRVCNRCI